MEKASTQQEGRATSQKECTPVRVFIRLTLDNRVEMCFIKEGLPLEIRQMFFARGQFEISFPYELPPSLLKRLGLKHYLILPGIYPVTEDSDFIKVCF
ncbi:MAG: hypothetical protein ACKOCO_13945 [Bacteroidota bacterium]|jgi:hypothetical protein